MSNSILPGCAEAAVGLRGIPSIFAMSNTGFPISTVAPVSVADGIGIVWSLRRDDGEGRGGGRGGGGGGGGGNGFVSSLSCS
jgi:hypothetical protein